MDKSIRGKRRARKLAVQALYQWLMSDAPLYDIEAQFRVIHVMEKIDVEYFCRLLHGVPEHLQALEAALTPFLDRSIQQLMPVELTVLRIGAFELMHAPEVPCRVVLDEAISLAKLFGSQDGHRYVNGVLHHLATQTRALEMKRNNE